MGWIWTQGTLSNCVTVVMFELRGNLWEYRNFEYKTLQIAIIHRFQLQERQYTHFRWKDVYFDLIYKNSSHVTIIWTLSIFPYISSKFKHYNSHTICMGDLWFEKLRSISVWEVFIKQHQPRDNDYHSILLIVCSRLSVYSMVGWGKTRVSSEKNKVKGEGMGREDHIVPPQSSCTLFLFYL